MLVLREAIMTVSFRQKSVRASAFLLFAVFLLPLPLIGAELIVTSSADSGEGSLREAIAMAQEGDTILLDPTQDDDPALTMTVRLTSGPLVIDKSITIFGIAQGRHVTVFVEQTGNGRVFEVNGDVNVTRSGLGVTGGSVKKRIANAKKDPTYLLADVEIVAEYKLANINRKALEALIHKFFSSARLDLELKDRFGSQVEPREWFLVPLSAIDEAIQRIKDGTIDQVKYDPEQATIVSS